VAALQKELRRHYLTNRVAPCPHPRCAKSAKQEYAKGDLVSHLKDIHGLPRLDRAVCIKQRKRVRDSISSDEFEELDGSEDSDGEGPSLKSDLFESSVSGNHILLDTPSTLPMCSRWNADCAAQPGAIGLDTSLQGPPSTLRNDFEQPNKSLRDKLSRIENQDFEKTSRYIKDGLDPWNADHDNGATSVGNSTVSQPTGTLPDPLLISQNASSLRTRLSMSPKSDASGLSASTAVDTNELQYQQLPTGPHLGTSNTG
jgi:hypothetical protein